MEDPVEELNPVQKAVDAAGSQTKLADLLGVSPQAVQQWVEKGEPPPKRVLDIERVVGGKVSRHELRPDIYPAEQGSAN